jgi:hypothetical protein
MKDDTQVVCSVCGTVISLDAGRYADQAGKPVHETCSLSKEMPAQNEPTRFSRLIPGRI